MAPANRRSLGQDLRCTWRPPTCLAVGQARASSTSERKSAVWRSSMKVHAGTGRYASHLIGNFPQGLMVPSATTDAGKELTSLPGPCNKACAAWLPHLCAKLHHYTLSQELTNTDS